MALAITLARHVPAFDAPGKEKSHLHHLHKLLVQKSHVKIPIISISIHDGDLYAFLQHLICDHGRQMWPHAWQALVQWLYATAIGRCHVLVQAHDEYVCHRVGIYDVVVPSTTSPQALALLAFRPQPLLPLNLGSARRAVTFVHGFVALVTANAYISTLGGGHFLCLHLAEAKRMARLQIAIADALHDPILKSKCRVNLAYNAMREGRFRRAQRILQHEERVATTLVNEELVNVCVAAHVYMAKTIKLHQEFLRQRAELTTKDRAVVDNFYRQRVVRKAH